MTEWTCGGSDSDQRSQSPKTKDREGVITYIDERRMKRGSVRWELTVGASSGQPQAYTSLCLFKLKCLFFSSFPYIAL